MGQYKHHVFVCTSGKTRPLSGAPVEAYLYVAPPGDNKIVEGEPQI